MAKTNKYGVSRKHKKYAEKTVPICRPPPLDSSCGNTKKIKCTSLQFKILKLISDGHNNTEIARKHNVNESSVRKTKELLINKKLISKLGHGVYSVTKLGRSLLVPSEIDVGMGVGSRASFPMEKNIHNYHFVVKINKFPRNWQQSHFYFESLKTKDFFMNQSTKQLHLYFDSCHIRIDISKSSMTFFIPEQTGNSYDEIESKCFDHFVKHYRVISEFGFKLSDKLNSNNPHFADPSGFFSKLATHCTDKLFKIDAGDLSFWIDRSLGQNSTEEETDSKDIAKRLEDLSNSAIHTEVNFYDMEKCLQIVSSLVKLQAMQMIPKELEPIKSNLMEADYIG